MEEEDIPLPMPIEQPTYKPAWETSEKTVQSVEDKKDADANELGNDGIIGTEFFDTVGKSWRSGGNFAVQVYNDVQRIADNGPKDPDWAPNAEKWAKTKGIDPKQIWRYTLTGNMAEAEAMLAASQEQAREMDVISRRAIVSSTIAQGVAGLIDVDAPVMLFSGGLSATAKAGINMTKAGRIASGVAAGGAVGTSLGAVSYSSDPNADWTIVPIVGLGGMAFGGIGGMMARVNTSRIAALDEVGENVAEGMPRAKERMDEEAFVDDDVYQSKATQEAEFKATEEAEAAPKPEGEVRKPVSVSIDEINKDAPHTDVEVDIHTAPQGRGSIGAAQLGNTGPGIASIRSTKIQDIIQSARTWVGKSGIAQDYHDGYSRLMSANGSVGKAVQRFQDIVDASPIATDFAKMMRSNSSVAQKLAYDVMENASGIVRNGRSAARIMEHYKRTLLGDFMDPYHNSFDAWAGRKYQAGFVRRQWDEGMRNEFDREVFFEMQSRRLDGVPATRDPDVKAAADALDSTFKKEIEVLKGRLGESDVLGSDTLVPKSGYVPQKWLGRNMRKMINSGAKTQKEIAEAIAEGYVRMHGMKADDAMIYAEAVVDRALRTDQGSNTGMIGLLSKDGRAELEDHLRRNGHDDKFIESFINRITGEMEEKGRAGFTKQRLDIDLRFTSSNGIRIVDLVDTDLSNLIPKRLSRSAGQAALARKGIRSRADFEDIKRSIKQEQIANGPNKPTGASMADRASDYIDRDVAIDDEFLDGLYSYFNGTAVAGGISPVISRMKKLTNLALLNQLGLTQMAEFGPMIASVGVKRFFEMAGKEVRDSLHKVDSDLVKELKHVNVFVPEERLFRDDLVFEFEKQTTQNDFARNVDRLLNKAQRIQGYTSGFYQMRKLQQRIAVTSAADRLARHFRDGGLISDQRLVDMGFDKQAMTRFSYYVNQNIVEFDAKGNLKKLNMDQWDPIDAEHFAMTLNANVNQLVQKAMVGESSMIFHKDGLAQLFWHLKSFPMLALEKQALRSARLMDNEAATAFMYGLATASAAYTVKQTINGRTDRLDYDEIAVGAFSLSNMTGWIPMWTDPLAGMLGMDGIGYSGPRGSANILSMPVSLDVLNRMAAAPGALINSVTEGPSTSDINTARVLPIIGNAYGFGYMWNAMKDSIKEQNAAKAKAAKEEKVVDKPAPKVEKKVDKTQELAETIMAAGAK